MVFALRTCYFYDREIGERGVDAPGDFVWTEIGTPNWYVPSARDSHLFVALSPVFIDRMCAARAGTLQYGRLESCPQANFARTSYRRVKIVRVWPVH